MVEKEVVVDATSLIPDPSPYISTADAPDTPHPTVGDKRRLHEVEDTDQKAVHDTHDHRTDTLRGLHRKNCTR